MLCSCSRPPGLPEREGEAQGPAWAQAAVIPPDRLAAQRRARPPGMASRHPGGRCCAAQGCLSASRASSAAAQLRVAYLGQGCRGAQGCLRACKGQTAAAPTQPAPYLGQASAAQRCLRGCRAYSGCGWSMSLSPVSFAAPARSQA